MQSPRGCHCLPDEQAKPLSFPIVTCPNKPKVKLLEDDHGSFCWRIHCYLCASIKQLTKCLKCDALLALLRFDEDLDKQGYTW